MIKSHFSLDGIVTIPENPIELQKGIEGRLKIILGNMLEDPVVLKEVKGDSIQSFEVPSEINLHYYVCHPCIANCLGYVTHSGSNWLVFSPHTFTLADYLKSKPRSITKSQRKFLCEQVDIVFKYLSEMNIFFDDLSLEGIFLSKQKYIKIYDFSNAIFDFSRDEKVLKKHYECKETLKKKCCVYHKD